MKHISKKQQIEQHVVFFTSTRGQSVGVEGQVNGCTLVFLEVRHDSECSTEATGVL